MGVLRRSDAGAKAEAGGRKKGKARVCQRFQQTKWWLRETRGRELRAFRKLRGKEAVVADSSSTDAVPQGMQVTRVRNENLEPGSVMVLERMAHLW